MKSSDFDDGNFSSENDPADAAPELKGKNDLFSQGCFDNRNLCLNGGLQKLPFHRFEPSEAAPDSPGK